MEPIVFEPYLRPMVWGNRRLADWGKALPAQGTYGESWEVSDHPLHVSRVAEGPFRGRTMRELRATHAGELFGTEAPPSGRFPLLIKLLDCHDWLSIQVHPSDALAARLAPSEGGKTEAWVVLEAAPTARIYAGLLPGTTRADLERHLAAGTVAGCLHSFTPRPGDCVFMPPGTVHAMGGGVVLAEVQQTSDATFRLFDWNRLGADGKPRPLHIAEALQAIDWHAGPVDQVTPQPLPDLPPGVRGERLVRCPYFALDRFAPIGQLTMPGGRLSIWNLLAGSVRLQSPTGYQRTFRRGETVLVPASGGAVSWTPLAGERPVLLRTLLER